MTCREFIDFLMEYLSGTLSVSAHVEFERHMAECLNCTAYLQSYQQTIKLGQAAFADLEGPVPHDVPEELIRAILASRRQDT